MLTTEQSIEEDAYELFIQRLNLPVCNMQLTK